MKRALVISGGGSKGAFAVGILQRLRSLYPNLHFDIIVGSSTGSLIAPLAATEELDVLENLYTTTTTEEIITAHRLGDRLGEKSVYTVQPLWELIGETFTDDRYNRIIASGKTLCIITTCLQTEESVVYTNHVVPSPSNMYEVKQLQAAGHLRHAVLASACQPVFMTPVKVDAEYSQGEDKNYQHVDGGVREYAGIQVAIDHGATEIFCILLSSGTGDTVKTEFTSLFDILQRTISMMVTDVSENDLYIPQQYVNALSYLAAVKDKMKADGIPQAKIDSYFNADDIDSPLEVAEPVKLFVLRPKSPLNGGPGGLVFDPTLNFDKETIVA